MTLRQRHKQIDRGHDLYETPAVATWALVHNEKLPHMLWEPAAGLGAMVRVLRAAGHEVLSTDLIERECLDLDYGGFDFCAPGTTLPTGIEAIITNPPFNLIQRFVERALFLCPRVYILARLGFLESEKRSVLLDCGSLARVLVFKNRLPMMHRHGWAGKKSTSTQAYAWYVFDRYHRGYPQLMRISWTPEK